MKTPLSLVIACLILATGCANDSTTTTTAPPASVSPVVASPSPALAADSIVVNAEKTLAVARDTFRFIAHEERRNREAFDKASPQIHEFVEYIRQNGVGWLRTAEAMKTAYKTNRSPENRANLLTAIATVSAALDQSQTYLKQAGFGATP